jgi:hypothetical protein
MCVTILTTAGLYARTCDWFLPGSNGSVLRGGTHIEDSGDDGLIRLVQGGFYVDIRESGYLVRFAPVSREEGQRVTEVPVASLLDAVTLILKTRARSPSPV